jgi:hypothetical protein
MEIPGRISPRLDQQREVINHAWHKENLLREVEELLYNGAE